jgi:hypothetical protein
VDELQLFEIKGKKSGNGSKHVGRSGIWGAEKEDKEEDRKEARRVN